MKGIIIVLIVVIMTMGFSIFDLKNDLDQSKRTLDYTTRHLDSKGGGTVMLTGEFINYNLKTFDSGKHWYAIEYDDCWGMTILGEAEDVYPGLLKHIDAMDKLTNHVSINGPIDLSSSDADLLRDAGFTIQAKE